MFKILFSRPYAIIRTTYFKNLHVSSRFLSNIAANYYAVLGLEPRASEDKVKDAYYELSKKYHPDKNFGNDMATQKIVEINEAFEILGNKAEKEKYDEKFFPIWQKPVKKASFIYEHTEFYEEPLINRIYRKKTSAFELKYQQYKKHSKGEKRRKMRHATQRNCFDKYMSTHYYSSNYRSK